MQAAMLLKEIPCYGHLLLHDVYWTFNKVFVISNINSFV